MATREHRHEETFTVAAERLFAILHTPSAIRRWWRAARAIVVPQAGGVWAATWGDDEDTPDYVTTAVIEHWQPPRLMALGKYVYASKTGPLPFQADFRTEFHVLQDGDNARLLVVQSGFPEGQAGDAFLAACAAGWQRTFAGIRSYLEESTQHGHAFVTATTSLFVVADLQRSIDFYHGKLGYRDPNTWGEPPCFCMLHRDGFDLMLKTPECPDQNQIHPNGPANIWDMYVRVMDIEAERLALTAAGVSIARGPERAFYDMIEMEVVDPDGYRICFGQPAT